MRGYMSVDDGIIADTNPRIKSAYALTRNVAWSGASDAEELTWALKGGVADAPSALMNSRPFLSVSATATLDRAGRSRRPVSLHHRGARWSGVQ